MKQPTDITDSRLYRRHKMVWKIVSAIMSSYTRRRFNYSCEIPELDSVPGPVIVTANHTCAWDLFFISTPFRARHLYYVASEHVARITFFGPIIMYLAAPITRTKGRLDLDVIKNCLRHLRAGHSICIFSEGEQSWDGITGDIFPATGKLVKNSGASLITYRIKGGFLTLPRWGKGIRRGKVEGEVAGIYTAEELSSMKPDEILDIIRRDLYFDIWEWQDSRPDGPVKYRISGKKSPANGLENLLFICPECRSICSLTTEDDRIRCSCGFSARFCSTGFLDGGSGFRTIAEWDKWQRGILSERIDALMSDPDSDEELFRDENVTLALIERDHSEEVLEEGPLTLKIKAGEAVITIGGRSFKVEKIRSMALMLTRLILFTYEKQYYQISADDTNIRKYLLVWQDLNKQE